MQIRIPGDESEDVRRLLEAGLDDAQIARRLHIPLGRAAQARAVLGFPPAPAPEAWASVQEKFTLYTVLLDGGHMVWTGERTQGLAPILSHRGRKLSVRKVAYRIEHGRPPAGHAKSGCVHFWCVAPAHQADAFDRSRERDTAAHLDAAAALLEAS